LTNESPNRASGSVALSLIRTILHLDQRELPVSETPTLVRPLDGMEKQGFIERREVPRSTRAAPLC
jgi:hypothetical protein